MQHFQHFPYQQVGAAQLTTQFPNHHHMRVMQQQEALGSAQMVALKVLVKWENGAWKPEVEETVLLGNFVAPVQPVVQGVGPDLRKCHNSGRRGHMAIDCTFEAKCFRCGLVGVGHISTNCPYGR